MDTAWQSATIADVWDALQEVDWAQPPRPVSEFFRHFTPVQSYKRLEARWKCNLFYYRTNYVIIVVAVFGVAMLRKPAALVGVAAYVLSALLMNDTFAYSLSDNLLRALKVVSPSLVMKIRASEGGHGGTGLGASKSSRAQVKVLGFKRNYVAAAVGLLGAAVLMLTRAYRPLMVAYALSALCVIVHATFRTPNFKARLASARDKLFKEAWRGYQTEQIADPFNQQTFNSYIYNSSNRQSGYGQEPTGYGSQSSYGGGGYRQRVATNPNISDATKERIMQGQGQGSTAYQVAQQQQHWQR